MTYENFVVPSNYWDYVLEQKRITFINEFYKKNKQYPIKEDIQHIILTDEEKEKYKRIFYARYCVNGIISDEVVQPDAPILPPVINSGSTEDDDIIFDIETLPNDEIWYTTKSKNIYTPFDVEFHNETYKTLFGANLVSNTYDNGKGIMKFDANVDRIYSKRFIYHTDDVISVYLPKSIKYWYGQGITDCGIKRVYFPVGAGLTSCHSFLNDCYNLEEVIIPNMYRSGDYRGTILNNCKNLRKITYRSNDYYPYVSSESYKDIGVNYDGEKIFYMRSWLVAHMNDIIEKYNFKIEKL